MLVSWISELDGWGFMMLSSAAEGILRRSMPSTTSKPIRPLSFFVPFLYDRIYLFWIAMNIDLMNQESDRYNNNKALYMQYHDAFVLSYSQSCVHRHRRGDHLDGRAQ